MKETMRKTIQRFVAYTLVVVTMLGLLNTNQLIAYGYTAQPGMIYSSNKSMVESKTTADPNGTKANGLLYGKPVTVVDEVKGTDGATWCKVTYKLKAGGTNTAYVPKANVLFDSAVSVFAYGHISASSVSFRDDAGTDRTTILATLNNGHKLELLDSTSVDGDLWYRVRTTVNGTSMIGWVYGSYVAIDDENIETDEEYEAYLRGLGFPESYIRSLSILHAKYPNWIFEPYFTELDWNTVIKAESKPGTSLVYKTEDDARKSYDPKVYDWTNNTWTIYDSTGWVQANPEFIAYCMDPRNWLNETNIWMFQSLAYNSAHTKESVAAIVKGTFMESTEILDYVTTFMEVAKESGVSAYHIAARIRQEQGVDGASHMISGKYPGYEGYYNYFNTGTYGVGEELFIRGLGFAKKQGWDTRYKSILGGATYLGKNYISVGQDTLYFQKFDVIATGGLYEHQYMTNIQAAISESKSLAKSADKTLAHVFKIPVYKNMPEEAVQYNVKGNRNNYLKSISVSGLSLTPTFNGATTEYSIIVDNAVSSITVSAAPVVSASKVTGTGAHALAVGTNIIKINCKSQSGETKTYTLTVVRQGDSEVGYSISSEEYLIEDYITGVTPGTTATDFVGKITCTGGTMKLLTSTGIEHTGTLGTGNKLAIYVNDSLVATKEVVVYGDVNGDAKINVLDAMIINKYTIGLTSLNGAYVKAADVNHDGKVNVLDAIIVNKYTIGLAEIQQK